MAVTRPTQKDIGIYEPKFVGPFTLRQAISIGIGGACCLIVSFATKSMGIDATTLFTLCFFIMIPFIAFAYVKPYGMKLEDFIKTYYEYHILAPPVRPYRTEVAIDFVKWEPKEEKTENNSNKKKQKTLKPVHKKNAEFPEYL